MAKRTFCDRCEAQCVNTTVAMNMTTVHHTKDNTYVGEDNYAPVEICLNCADELKAAFPQLFKLRPREDDPPIREAMMAPVAMEYRDRAEERR